ncbi:alpha-amylase family glycosyl hydrolase [Edaphobacter modestus]|uniref:Glycosidase n=1 Tax=Edaphobacter modestus TaxID=388466 RepID=A0A4Q7YWU6_9BACT|nr:glycosidase [Edaphobacter modestus]
MAEKSLSNLNLGGMVANQDFFPSPTHWEDEVVYFLMLDRFSNAKESGFRDNNGNPVSAGTTPPFVPGDNGNAIRTPSDAAAWRDAGTNFVGGNLAGVESKLGYLKRLGVTVLWISPVFKQVNADNSYHGYGIQHFLDVDPHFGTRDDLRRLVNTAHSMGMRIILDIILNHSGDVFRYEQDNPSWNGQQFRVRGFRDSAGNPTLPFAPIDLGIHPEAFPDAGIWPSELQTADTFTREGHIKNFDFFPEFADGDFFGLKDLHHGERKLLNGVDQIDDYSVSPTLGHLCEVYKFWIAFADLDGFRLDTVKHMDPGAARFFSSAIHEFAEAIGKENFYVIGEITGGREFAFDRLEVTGLDAALGISDERAKMIGLVKGETNPTEYFDLFRNSLLLRKDSHVWFRDKVVTSVDDHDHVDQGEQKHRFCAGGFGKLVLAVMALNATTLGIPCIYYGTEQLFDGEGGGNASDRYIRESMFGGRFGAFRSHDRHFFIDDQPVYQELSKIHKLRRERLPLRRGRQFLRQISGDGQHFGFPERIGAGRMRSIVSWSRIFDENELLCAINTDPDNETSAFVTIDNDLHAPGSVLTCVYSTKAPEIGQKLTVESMNGKAIFLTVPPAGFVVYG